MPIRIFTIPFNEETQTFHDDLVQQFCVNKRVHKIEIFYATFLNCPQNGLPFLGRRIFPGIIRLRTENLRRITRRIELRERAFLSGDLDEAAFLHSLNSYWAMLSY